MNNVKVWCETIKQVNVLKKVKYQNKERLVRDILLLIKYNNA